MSDVIIVNCNHAGSGKIVIDVRENSGTQYMILTRRACRSLRETLTRLDLDAEVTPDE